MYPSVSWTVRPRTFTSGHRRFTSAVASMPFSSGMLMSIKTTLGWVSSTFSSASRPLAASPTTSMSGWLRRMSPMPSRIIC